MTATGMVPITVCTNFALEKKRRREMRDEELAGGHGTFVLAIHWGVWPISRSPSDLPRRVLQIYGPSGQRADEIIRIRLIHVQVPGIPGWKGTGQPGGPCSSSATTWLETGTTKLCQRVQARTPLTARWTRPFVGGKGSGYLFECLGSWIGWNGFGYGFPT